MSNDNDDQKVFWEEFAEKWVTQQDELDALLAPVLDRVFDKAALQPGQNVLDIGCGTGTSSLDAAESVGPAGRVLGVDISEPMLVRARAAGKNTANLAFQTADAAHYAFDPAHFDVVISRFGVMFFADPVTAFVNIRRALRPGARVIMATWSTLDRNPWFRVPMYAAKARLGAPPPIDPDDPGPLAFRDIKRVTGILQAAGFEAVEGAFEDLKLTPPGDVQKVSRHACTIGPVSRTMAYFEGTEADLEAIANEVASAFAAYQQPDGIRVPARINFFTATAP